MSDRVGQSCASDHSPELRSIPGFAEFAEAFCRGFNAHKDGLSEDGEEFMAGLMAEYEKWQGKRLDRIEELENVLREVLHHFAGRRIGYAPYPVYSDVLVCVTDVTRWRAVLDA